MPRFRIVLTRGSLRIALERHSRTTLGDRPPAIQHRRRQSMPPTHLAHRHARLLRLAQNLDLLLRRKSWILAFAHELRSLCGAPAADRSLSIFTLAFCPEVAEATQGCQLFPEMIYPSMCQVTFVSCGDGAECRHPFLPIGGGGLIWNGTALAVLSWAAKQQNESRTGPECLK